eukprot:COSAG02_NODE_26989_length_619_cov_1.376923_1_plen_181_part_10
MASAPLKNMDFSMMAQLEKEGEIINPRLAQRETGPITAVDLDRANYTPANMQRLQQELEQRVPDKNIGLSQGNEEKVLGTETRNYTVFYCPTCKDHIMSRPLIHGCKKTEKNAAEQRKRKKLYTQELDKLFKAGYTVPADTKYYDEDGIIHLCLLQDPVKFAQQVCSIPPEKAVEEAMCLV